MCPTGHVTMVIYWNPIRLDGEHRRVGLNHEGYEMKWTRSRKVILNVAGIFGVLVMIPGLVQIQIFMAATDGTKLLMQATAPPTEPTVVVVNQMLPVPE